MDDRWLAFYVWIVHPQELQVQQAIRLISHGQINYRMIHELRSRKKPMAWKRIAEIAGICAEVLRASYHKWLTKGDYNHAI